MTSPPKSSANFRLSSCRSVVETLKGCLDVQKKSLISLHCHGVALADVVFLLHSCVCVLGQLAVSPLAISRSSTKRQRRSLPFPPPTFENYIDVKKGLFGVQVMSPSSLPFFAFVSELHLSFAFNGRCNLRFRSGQAKEKESERD